MILKSAFINAFKDRRVDNYACCCACAEPAVTLVHGLHLCNECCDELVSGQIKNHNLHFIGHDAHPPLDDIGPWQENAIRIMEGDKCFSFAP